MLSFSKMVEANKGQFYSTDYMHYFLKHSNFSSDFVSCILSIFQAELTVIDGLLLVPAIGAQARYRKFRSEGLEPGVAQYWSNLTEITNLLGPIDSTTAQRLAVGVKSCWDASVAGFAQASTHDVRVLIDTVDDEVFVTLSTYWPETK